MRSSRNAIDRQHLAQHVREAMFQKDLTQAQIAKHLDVTQQAVNDWVNGKKMPSRKNLKNLTALLGITESNLSIHPTEHTSPEGTTGQVTFLFTINGQPFFEVDLLVTGSRMAAEQITLDMSADAGAILKGDLKGNVKGKIQVNQ